jgi:hypothetical protein
MDQKQWIDYLQDKLEQAAIHHDEETQGYPNYYYTKAVYETIQLILAKAEEETE